jgi:hypothetical protein
MKTLLQDTMKCNYLIHVQVVYPLDVIRRQMQVSSDHNQLIAGFVLRLGLIGVRVA